jgi:hypothetical protein
MRAAYFFLFVLGWLHSCLAATVADPIEQQLQTVFAELRALKPMQAGETYTVKVAGIEEKGRKEQFLRRRTAQEVSASGLSSGCGDYALLFIARAESLGFRTLLVDGAEISSGSLQNHFSGHAVVALRRKEEAADPWWLVDSTNLKILSRNWSPGETSFQAFGHVFWIGFCGPQSEYPVRNAEDLKEFYSNTLARTPHEFLGRYLFRLKFSIDPTLIGKNGEYLNPRLADFIQMQSRIFTVYGIEPQQEVSILLRSGGDNTESDLTFSQSDGWVSHVGLRSGCSSGLLSYFEHVIGSQKR